MPTTVISTIENSKTAQKLINELVEAGFKKQDVGKRGLVGTSLRN